MRTLLILCAGLTTLVIGSDRFVDSAHGQSLRYDWQPGQKFSYRFAISVETGSSIIKYNGMTHYTVGDVANDQLKITYTGGLRESSTRKSSAGRPRGFGPFGGGPPRIPSPFSRPTFGGKTQTTNKITISPRGSVIAMEGKSQLPYLLGNVSLLPFETLPGQDEQEWSTDSGIAITEKSDSGRSRFDPFGPFGGNEKESVQSAGERTRYRILEPAEDLITVRRTYEMKMPPSSDDESYDMDGTGTWVFDTRENISHSLDMNYKLTVTQGGTTTTVPITVKYSRVDPAELEKMAAEAKRKADEKAQAAAAAKAAAETPLSLDEKREALRVLGDQDLQAVTATLGELAKKTLKNPDPEVANAIESWLANENPAIAKSASKALLNWSASYRLKKSLAKAYQGPGVLKSTGRIVESITPLTVGQLVQAQQPRYGSFWRAAKVEALLPDGTVKLGFLTWGKVKSNAIVDRRSIQLAPPELEQPVELNPTVAATPPARPAPANSRAAMPMTGAIASEIAPMPKAGSQQSTQPSSSEPRTWSDATGRFKVNAVFVSMGDGTVNIRRTSDERLISIPIAKLSAADQAFLKELEAAENPFAVP